VPFCKLGLGSGCKELATCCSYLTVHDMVPISPRMELGTFPTTVSPDLDFLWSCGYVIMSYVITH
jgi:hypothetical protein